MFQTFYNINHSRLILTNETLPENTQTKYNSRATQNTSKQYYPGSVAFYDTRPGNEVDIFYNDHKPTVDRAASVKLSSTALMHWM